jgi:hypothetical protein
LRGDSAKPTEISLQWSKAQERGSQGSTARCTSCSQKANSRQRLGERRRLELISPGGNGFGVRDELLG